MARVAYGINDGSWGMAEVDDPMKSAKVQAGGVFKSAAVTVLRMFGRLMTTGEITKAAVEKGLIKCQGRTPEATMASALYTDVKRKLIHSVFTRPQEGLFGLREWIAAGYVPECPPAFHNNDSCPPAKKQRCGFSRAVNGGGPLFEITSAQDASDMFRHLDTEMAPDLASEDVFMLTAPEGTRNILSACDEPGKDSAYGPDLDEAPWPPAAASDLQGPQQLHDQTDLPECTWDDLVSHWSSSSSSPIWEGCAAPKRAPKLWSLQETMDGPSVLVPQRKRSYTIQPWECSPEGPNGVTTDEAAAFPSDQGTPGREGSWSEVCTTWHQADGTLAANNAAIRGFARPRPCQGPLDAPRGSCGTSVLPLKPGQPQAMYEEDDCDVHFYGDDQLLDCPERTESEERAAEEEKLARLAAMEAHIRRLERTMGPESTQVGQACLLISRQYRAHGGLDFTKLADQALARWGLTPLQLFVQQCRPRSPPAAPSKLQWRGLGVTCCRIQKLLLLGML